MPPYQSWIKVIYFNVFGVTDRLADLLSIKLIIMHRNQLKHESLLTILVD